MLICGSLLSLADTAVAEPVARSREAIINANEFEGGIYYFDLRQDLLVQSGTGPVRGLLVGTPTSGAQWLVGPAVVEGGCIRIEISPNATAGDLQPGGGETGEGEPIVIPFTLQGVASGYTSAGQLTVTTGTADVVPQRAACPTPTAVENAAPSRADGQTGPIQLTGSDRIDLPSLVTDLDQDDLTFTVEGALAGILTPSSGAVQALSYTAPPPNDSGQIADSFTLRITDGQNHPGETDLLLTFTLNRTQSWSASGGPSVAGAVACSSGPGGSTCQVGPGALRLTLDFGPAVSTTDPTAEFDWSVEVSGGDGEEADLGTLTPDFGTFNKTSAGVVTGQSTLTYDYPAERTAPVTLTYVISSGGFTEVGSLQVTFNPTQELSQSALSPNQRSVATRIDYICPRLQEQLENLTSGELQLLRQCGNLTNSQVVSASEIAAAMQSIAAEEIAAQKRTTVDLARGTNQVLGARAAALRAGVRGISLAGLNLNVDGQNVLVQPLQTWLNKALGGAAGADDGDSDLFRRLGIFIQAQLDLGDKDKTALESGFEYDTLGGTVGVDYRFRDDFVMGVAVNYYESDVDFDEDLSKLEGESLGLSLYGSFYPTQSFYIDFLAGAGWSDYAQSRTVGYSFMNGTSYMTRLAGDTSGKQLFAGLNSGYEFTFGGLSITPLVKLHYLDGTIDAYTERARDTSALTCFPDCSAWDLSIAKQDVKSFTASGGIQIAYTWSGKWGVLRPYLRADAVHEFEDEGRVILARLVNDNQIQGPIGSDTGPITITTEEPDSDFFILGAGVSVQFARGIAGFVDYQRMEGYENFSAQSVALGLRYEVKFR